MDKKGQLNFREVISLAFMGLFLIIIIPIITSILNSFSGESINIDSIVSAFIPLFIFAVIFELIRRFFR